MHPSKDTISKTVTCLSFSMKINSFPVVTRRNSNAKQSASNQHPKGKRRAILFMITNIFHTKSENVLRHKNFYKKSVEFTRTNRKFTNSRQKVTSFFHK